MLYAEAVSCIWGSCGVSVCEHHEAPGSSAGPEGTWHPDGVTELLCFEGLGKVLPRGGAVELSFEDPEFTR